MVLEKVVVLFFVTFVFLLSGCQNNDGSILRYDLLSGVTHLDPQFAQDPEAQMIIANTMECLFTQSADGSVTLGAAENYTVNADGTVYTFVLRKDRYWWRSAREEPTPVTAQDFAFGLRRLFSPQSISPFAAQLNNVKNAQSIAQGAAPVESLGVEALDDHTLRITLDQPDASLPVLLSNSWAAPCNETFFQETKARYGRSLSHLQFNGPFYIRSWDNDNAILLRRNPSYTKTSVSAGANLYIPSAIAQTTAGYDPDTVQRFFSGQTDAALLPASNRQQAEEAGNSLTEISNTVYGLTFNHRHSGLSHVELRRAIAYCIDRKAVEETLQEGQTPTRTLIPPSVPIGEESYREEVGDTSPQNYSQDLSKRSLTAYRQLSELPRTLELICSEDTGQLRLAGILQRCIQQSLGISVRVTKVSDAELAYRVSTGNFQLALSSFAPAYPSPSALLSLFEAQSDQNFSGYENPRFDHLLHTASALPLEAQASAYSNAEQLLLSDAGIVPLYVESSYFACDREIDGVEYSPFLSGLRLR